MVLPRRTRTVLKLIFIAFFALIAPYMMLKMLGLVIDLKHWRLAKAGSLYVRVEPRTASLSLNGEPYPTEASYLGHDIYIPGMTPDIYELSLSLDNYSSWKKRLAVDSGKVAYASDIILWPLSLPVEGSSTNISTFAIANGMLVTNSTSSALSINGVSLPGTNIIIAHNNTPYIVTQKNSRYYYTDLNTPKISTNISDLFLTLQKTIPENLSPSPIQFITSHPFSGTKLLVANNTSFFALDMKKNSMEMLFHGNKILAYTTSGNELLVVDNKGSLIVANLIVHSVNTFTTHLEFARKMISDASGNNILIEDENSDLFIFNRQSQTLKKLAQNIAYYTFSSDGRRAVYIDKTNTMNVLYLAQYEDNVLHMLNDIETIRLTEGEIPRTFSWIPFTQNYFLIQAGNKVLIEEFDIRTPRNIATLARDVTHYTINDSLYLLHTNKTLTWSDIEP